MVWMGLLIIMNIILYLMVWDNAFLCQKQKIIMKMPECWRPFLAVPYLVVLLPERPSCISMGSTHFIQESVDRSTDTHTKRQTGPTFYPRLLMREGIILIWIWCLFVPVIDRLISSSYYNLLSVFAGENQGRNPIGKALVKNKVWLHSVVCFLQLVFIVLSFYDLLRCSSLSL